MGWLLVVVALALSPVAGTDAYGGDGKCRQQIGIELAPFVASLQKITEGHVCSATLLTPTWLLTAAQCTVDTLGRPRSTSHYFVLMGSSRISNYITSKEGIRGWPNLFVVHPMFKTEGTIDYDLAMIRLQSPLEASSRVSFVTLPQDVVPEKILQSRNCSTVGWTNTEKKGNDQSDWKLIEVNLKLVGTTDCSEKLSRNVREYVHLCTDSECKGVEHGDSGSALVCQGVQVGVVSFVVGCPQPYQGVYARLDTQMPWVLQVTAAAAATHAAPAGPNTAALSAASACALLALRRSFP